MLLFAAAMIPLYWISFFPISSHMIEEKCYLTCESAFPAADAWMASTAFLGFIGLLRHKSWGALFALLAASTIIFRGLLHVLFDLEHGIYGMASPEAATEIAINIVTLVLGPVVIWYVWTRRHTLL